MCVREGVGTKHSLTIDFYVLIFLFDFFSSDISTIQDSKSNSESMQTNDEV